MQAEFFDNTYSSYIISQPKHSCCDILLWYTEVNMFKARAFLFWCTFVRDFVMTPMCSKQDLASQKLLPLYYSLNTLYWKKTTTYFSFCPQWMHCASIATETWIKLKIVNTLRVGQQRFFSPLCSSTNDFYSKLHYKPGHHICRVR